MTFIKDMEKINTKKNINKNTRSERVRSKKYRFTFMFLKFSIMFFLLSLSIYGGFMFYNTHDFRSPVIFQNPVPKKVLNLESPVSSQSAFIGQAIAEEIENPFDKKSPKGIAWEKNKEVFGISNWDSLEELITNESGWNPYNVNKSSGACGLGQALPCSKMNCEKWDYECQIDWVLNYIKDRYETPTKALAHWNARVKINGQDVGNWY